MAHDALAALQRSACFRLLSSCLSSSPLLDVDEDDELMPTVLDERSSTFVDGGVNCILRTSVNP